MKLFLTLVCCLAIPAVGFADQNNQKKKKNQGQGQGQGQNQGQGQGRGQGQQGLGQHQGRRANLGQGQGQGQGLGQHQGRRANLGQGQGQGQGQGLGQGQGKHKGRNAGQQGNMAGQGQGQGQGKHQGKNAGQQANMGQNQGQGLGQKGKHNFQSKHVNFHAKANPAIAAVKFNKNFHIPGSQNWHGKNYIVFQSYHPMWHDHFWWHSHYNNCLLIGGGWYYWNAGYWFPAWGYDEGAAYYPYDGPIYVGSNPTPHDQVVSDVQSALQEQGYYHGEVDGLLGPLTRAALADYQRDQGLETTAAVDEPTLDALGIS